MTITADTIEEMTEIVAGLVREGLMFTSARKGDYWVIELTGGY